MLGVLQEQGVLIEQAEQVASQMKPTIAMLATVIGAHAELELKKAKVTERLLDPSAAM